MASVPASATGHAGVRVHSQPLSESTAWCVAGAALALLLCLAGGSALLNDPDTQWHIAAGRWMIDNGSLPRTDMLSHSFAGQPWIAKEWLSQLILASAWKLGGWPMVAALTATAMASTVFLVMVHVGRHEGPTAGFSIGILSFAIVAATVVARPHVLVFPIVVAWTIYLSDGAATTRRPPWLALPLLALWANMHAGFTMGLVIAAAFGLEALLRSEPADRLATAARWLAFGVACLAMGIATPYGAEPLLLNVTMAGGNEAIPYIGEWRSMPASPRSAALLALAGASVWMLSRRPIDNAARILLLALLTLMMVRHDRFVMIFGLVAPVVAGPLLWQMAVGVCRRLELFQNGMGAPAGMTAHRAAAGSSVIALAAILLNPIALPAHVAPAAALAAVPAELRAERAFNSYNFGGFLANNNIKTFIDGRTDQLFLGGFMTRVVQASTATEAGPLASLLDEYEVKWAMIEATAPETMLFPRLPGWQLLHQDPLAHVYKRRP